MATTTPNFGWPVPTSTDLVKDGATAIEALGDGVDASLVDLKGGTTGQVLSKASNTDMDFTWVTDAAGDITGVTAGTGITGGGTSGTVTVSFDQANYGGGQFAAGKNKFLNGDFSVNQRNFVSSTTSGAYGFDRWFTESTGGTVTSSAQPFTAGTAPVAGYEGTNFLRVLTASQSAVNNYAAFDQRIENVRTFAGQTITLSFWAKAASGTPKVSVEMIQDFGSGGSSRVNTAASAATTISTSWVRYSVTISIPSISGKTIGTSSYLELFLWVSAGTNFTSRTNSIGLQNNTFDFWGLQIEAGSVATPFQTATGTVQGELAACQRYYQRYTIPVSYFTVQGITANSTTICRIPVKIPSMRKAPTTPDYSGLQIQRQATDVQYDSGTWTIPSSTPEICVLDYTHGSAVFTAGETLMWRTGASGGYFGFTAEL